MITPVNQRRPQFPALCPRCNDIHFTDDWGGPWDCPDCAKGAHRAGMPTMSRQAWGAGS